jgi:hypothetical protein
MPQRTIAAGGGNWNSTATWVEGAVPTASDFVVGNASSGQLTINVAASAQYLDLSLYTNTITINANLTLGLAAATTTFSSTTTITGSDTAGGIVCNVTHTFTQNTTTRIPRLFIGAGTKTLTTNMYCRRYFLNQTTGTLNGFSIFIDLELGSPSGTFRQNGTTWLTIDGNASITSSGYLGAIGIRIDAPSGTISRTGGVLLLSDNVEILNGTITFAGTTQGLISIGGAQTVFNAKITNGQQFNIATTNSTVSCNFYDTTSTIANISLNGQNGTYTITSNTDLNIGRVFLLPQFAGNDILLFNTTNIFNIGEIISTSPLDASRIGTNTFNQIKSTIGGTKAKINYTGTTGTMNYYTTFTDIDASYGNTIYNLNGTITNSNNITNITNVIPSGGGGESSYVFIS